MGGARLLVLGLVALAGTLALPAFGEASTYGAGVYGGGPYNLSLLGSGAGGTCLNCAGNEGSQTSGTGTGTSGSTTPPQTPKTPAGGSKSGSGSASSTVTGGSASSTPFRCADTSTVDEGLSPAGLVNLLVSLGIIPDAKAKPACDALSAKSAETPSTTSVTPFSVPLRLGARGAEVTRLQVFLNARGFTIAESGPGSRGNETDFYGVLTERAVKRFQAAYGAEILVPVSLTAPSGFWGPSSMKKANALLSV